MISISSLFDIKVSTGYNNLMTRLPQDGPEQKRVGNPYASPSPRTDQDSLLDFYFGHPTSLNANVGHDSPVGLGRSAGDMDDDL